jgi:hypothetical protein
MLSTKCFYSLKYVYIILLRTNTKLTILSNTLLNEGLSMIGVILYIVHVAYNYIRQQLVDIAIS